MSSTILKLDQITKSYDNQIIFSNLSFQLFTRKQTNDKFMLIPFSFGRIL